MRRRLKGHLIEPDLLAGEAHRSTGISPQGVHRLNGLDQPAHPARVGHPDGRELALGLGVRKAGAQAQDQPPARDLVQRCGGLRQQQRGTQGSQQHRSSELHTLSARGDGGKHQQRVVPGSGQWTVSHPHGVEAQLLGALGQSEQRRDLRPPQRHRVSRGQQIPDRDRVGIKRGHAGYNCTVVQGTFRAKTP